jgi:large subunit ribosomal protein L24
MKLKREDTVMVMAGRDKGKTGIVLSVIPTEGKVVVEGINIAKRHTKPSDKHPRGGILELTKPIDVSKLMVLDPETKLPARIGYKINADGSKERIFKVSAQRKNAKKDKAPKKSETKKDEVKDEVKPKAKVEKPKAAVKKTVKKTDEAAK